MGVRQKLNDLPKVGIVVTAVLVVGVYAVVAWEIRGPKFGGHGQLRSYYSDDDGKSYFVDDAALMPPFDHGGATAVRCYVFQCGGKIFVGFLEKFSDEVMAGLNKPMVRGDKPLDFRGGTLVKRPGDHDWVKKYSRKGEAIQQVKCPDGSADQPQYVKP